MKQGKTLFRAIDALETIRRTGSLERALVWLMLEAYRHRLRETIKAAPSRMREKALSPSQAVGRDRAAVWLSNNQRAFEGRDSEGATEGVGR